MFSFVAFNLTNIFKRISRKTNTNFIANKQSGLSIGHNTIDLKGGADVQTNGWTLDLSFTYYMPTAPSVVAA